MLLQSGAQGGEVPVGDTTYAALSKDWGITTIYRTSYPNQTVMLTSEHGVHRKNCRVNTVLTDIRWLNGFNTGSGVKRAWNGSAVQSLHSVNHLSVTETDACCQHTVHDYSKTQTRGHCSSGDWAGGPIRISHCIFEPDTFPASYECDWVSGGGSGDWLVATLQSVCPKTVECFIVITFMLRCMKIYIT